MSSVIELAYFLIFLQFFTLFICFLIKNSMIIFYPSYKTPESFNYMIIPLTSFRNYTNFSCLLINTTFKFNFCINSGYGCDIILVGYSPQTIPAYKYLREYTKIYVFNSTVNISSLCKKTYYLEKNIKFCMNGTNYIFIVNFSKITPKEEYFLKKIFITIYKRTFTAPSPAIQSYTPNDLMSLMINSGRDFNVFYCYRLVDNFTTKKPDLLITIYAIGYPTYINSCFTCIKALKPYFIRDLNKIYNSSLDTEMYYYYSNLSESLVNTINEICNISCRGVVMNFTSKVFYNSTSNCAGSSMLLYRIYKSTGKPLINITNTSFSTYKLNLTYIGKTPVIIYKTSTVPTTVYVMNISVNLSIWYLEVRS